MWLGYIALGLTAGIAGGFFGIGGAIVMVPVLVYLFGFSQATAQGTTLAAMIPPIGLLAALQYYYRGQVNIKVALFICLGFFVGGLIGAVLVGKVSEPVLKKSFGILMLIASLKIILGK